MSSKQQARSEARGNPQLPKPATGRDILPKRPAPPAILIQRAELDPGALAPRDVLRLQRTIGNLAVGRLLGGMSGQRRENKTGIPDHLKSGLENQSGMDLSDVRVHYNSPEPARLKALAYTEGQHIHLAPGQEKHLPHEAWHVVQQRQGRVRPTTQLKGVGINDDPSLEQEADALGRRAAGSVTQTEEGSVVGPSAAAARNPTPVLQCKAGVEYETKWEISGDKQGQHKKPIYSTQGWRMESDANYLEFVVEPPKESAETLRDEVKKMGEFATTKIQGPISTAVNQLEVIKANIVLYGQIFNGIIKKIREFNSIPNQVRDRFGKISGDLKVMYPVETFWEDTLTFINNLPEGEELDEESESKLSKIEETFKNISSQVPDKRNSAKAADLIGEGNLVAPFKDKIITGTEEKMYGKAQFTFGISLDRITDFLDKFGKGELPDADQITDKAFNLESSQEKKKLGDYLKEKYSASVAGAKGKAVAAIGNEAVSPQLQGFITFIAHYVQRMQSQMEGHKPYMAAFVAQKFLKIPAERFDEQAFVQGLPAKEKEGYEYLKKDLLKLADEQLIANASRVTIQGVLDKQLKELNYPKYWFPLMERSGFDSLYHTLSQDDKGKFVQLKGSIIAQMGMQAGDPLFLTPYTWKNVADEKGLSRGPTIGEWLDSIAASAPEAPQKARIRDVLSPPAEFVGLPKESQSMGALGKMEEGIRVKKELLTAENLPTAKELLATDTKPQQQAPNYIEGVKRSVIELRGFGDFVPPEDWADHTYAMAVIYSLMSDGELYSAEYAKKLKAHD